MTFVFRATSAHPDSVNFLKLAYVSCQTYCPPILSYTSPHPHRCYRDQVLNLAALVFVQLDRVSSLFSPTLHLILPLPWQSDSLRLFAFARRRSLPVSMAPLRAVSLTTLALTCALVSEPSAGPTKRPGR